MKRFIKWFRQWVGKMKKVEKKVLLISAVICLFVGIFMFVSADKVPATVIDYEPMEKQVVAIQQNPDLIYETDCNITVKNKIITVSFMNDECKLIAKYNQNFELLSTQKEDNCIGLWLVLLHSIIFGFALFAISFCWLSLLAPMFEELGKWICKKIHSIKTKFKSK